MWWNTAVLTIVCLVLWGDRYYWEGDNWGPGVAAVEDKPEDKDDKEGFKLPRKRKVAGPAVHGFGGFKVNAVAPVVEPPPRLIVKIINASQVRW